MSVFQLEPLVLCVGCPKPSSLSSRTSLHETENKMGMEGGGGGGGVWKGGRGLELPQLPLFGLVSC